MLKRKIISFLTSIFLLINILTPAAYAVNLDTNAEEYTISMTNAAYTRKNKPDYNYGLAYGNGYKYGYAMTGGDRNNHFFTYGQFNLGSIPKNLLSDENIKIKLSLYMGGIYSTQDCYDFSVKIHNDYCDYYDSASVTYNIAREMGLHDSGTVICSRSSQTPVKRTVFEAYINPKLVLNALKSGNNNIVTISITGLNSDNRSHFLIDHPDTKLTITNSDTYNVTGITLSGKTEMSVGDTQHIQAKIYPLKANNKKVTWTSSNPNIATVNANGNVTAKASGSVTITARTQEGGYSDNISIYINSKNDYSYYKYWFGNHQYYFGYPYHYEGEHIIGDDYYIPKERYLQLGYSTPVAWLKSKTKWGGNCFGMSMSSILFYKNVMSEESYGKSYPIEFDMPDSQTDINERKLREVIELLQISQFLDLDQPDFSVDAVVQEIDNGNPVKFGLKSDAGGHAVVIYNYTVDENGVYIFDIYDCSSFVTHFLYLNKNTWSFIYNDPEYEWEPNNYCTYQNLKKLHDKIKNENNFNAATLFSLNNEPSQLYILSYSDNIYIKNSTNQTATIKAGEITSEISGISVIPSSYLEEKTSYNITLPNDTYTIVEGDNEISTLSIANDYIAVEITHNPTIPITISDDLHKIKIENTEKSNYKVKYTTYDNVFDEISISGVSSNPLNISLDGANVSISGADSISAAASVSGIETSVAANDVNGENATVTSENSTNLQILVNDAAVTEAKPLAERQQTPIPDYDLESGEYTEKQTLTFTKDDDTLIYYTTDGSTPSKDNGLLYTLPIEIKQSVTIKAIATKYGYTDSDTLSLSYTLPVIPSPYTTLSSGSYDTVQTLELFGDENAEIYYTLDGTPPYENGILYSSPVAIYEDTILKVCASVNGVVSEVSEYEYIINHQLPIYIDDSFTNQDGILINSSNLSSLTKISFPIYKQSDDSINAIFYVAYYNGDTLIKLTEVSKEITEKESVIEITDTNTPNTNKLKIFAWDQKDNITPVSNNIEIK